MNGSHILVSSYVTLETINFESGTRSTEAGCEGRQMEEVVLSLGSVSSDAICILLY